MGALELARAFGMDEVELPAPPGFGARIRRRDVQQLLLSRELPEVLRREAIAVGTKLDGGKLDEKSIEVATVEAEALDWAYAKMVIALRPGLDAEWESVSLTADDFRELPPATQQALRMIYRGEMTPAMVTAAVRRNVRRDISAEEAAELLAAERPKLVGSWASFRHQPAGPGPGADGTDVEPQPVELPARDRPRRRTRAR